MSLPWETCTVKMDRLLVVKVPSFFRQHFPSSACIAWYKERRFFNGKSLEEFSVCHGVESTTYLVSN